MHLPLIKDFTEAHHHDHHLPVDASNPKSNAQKYYYYYLTAKESFPVTLILAVQ